MATTKLTGRQLNFQGNAAYSGSAGPANASIAENAGGLVLSASRVYLGQAPADSLEAATKGYVDSVAGGGVTANQIAFGNSDGSGVSSDAGLVYNPNTDTLGVSGSINFGDGSTANFIYGSSTDGLRLSGSKAELKTATADIVLDGKTGIALKEDGTSVLSIDTSKNLTVANAAAIDIDGSGAISIDSSGGAITIDGAAASSFVTSAGNLELNSEAATLVLDGHTGVDIDATNSGKVSIDGAGGIDIGVAADVAIDIDSAALDIDASGAITIDSTSTISIDAADDLNLTVTSSGAGEDLTISQIGGNDSSILITAAGTGTDAVSIDATAGSMVIAPSLANAKSLTIGPASATQMVFSPHGTPASELISLTNTAGVAVSDSAAAVQVTATAGAVTLNAGVANAAAVRLVASNAAGGVDIDSGTAGTAIDSTGGVVIGAASASSFTVASGEDNEDLTIEVTGANDASVLIKSSGTGADAISLTTSAGGMDLTVAGAAAGEDLDIVANSSVNISSSEDVADAITLNASAGGIDITAAGAASEDIDIVNTAGSINITAGEAVTDAIVINGQGGGTIKLQTGGNTALYMDTTGLVVNPNFGITNAGTFSSSGSMVFMVPNYIHNSAVVTSGASATAQYGTVTAGSGIAGAAAAGTNSKALGISLLTGSLRVLGANFGGVGTTGLLPESLRVYQNGLLLASGAANDYSIAQYNFTSGSKVGFDVKLFTAPVAGDVFQVDVSAKMQA